MTSDIYSNFFNNHSYGHLSLCHHSLFDFILTKIKNNDIKHDFAIVDTISSKRAGNLLHHVLNNNRFIGKTIQHEIKNKIAKNQFVCFKLKHINHNLNIELILTLFLPHDIIDANHELSYLSHITHIVDTIADIFICTKRHHMKQTKQIDIDLTIIHNDCKKYFVNNQLNADNINSGSCIAFDSIVIWRTEEILKVLIHELVHFFMLDFGNCIEADIDFSKKIFGVSNDVLNESFTDSFAIIIHTLFVAYFGNKKSNHTNILNLFNQEINFVLFQAAKIIDTFDVNIANQLTFRNVKQSTSAFSYYIVKAALLCNLNNLCDFINEFISHSHYDISTFVLFVKHSMNQKLFVQAIMHYLSLFNDTNKRNKIFKQLLQTMRMTHLSFL